MLIGKCVQYDTILIKFKCMQNHTIVRKCIGIFEV